ncbi:Ribonuclease J 1 [compost metagenome]
MDDAREIVKKVLRNCEEKKITDWATMKTNIKDELRNFLYEKTKRRPMILPIIMEI